MAFGCRVQRNVANSAKIGATLQEGSSAKRDVYVEMPTRWLVTVLYSLFYRVSFKNYDFVT